MTPPADRSWDVPCSLMRISSQTKGKKLSSGRAHNKGGGGQERLHARAPQNLPTRYSQLAEAVEPRKSTTGVLYGARNLIMVQLPAEERERKLTVQSEFSTRPATRTGRAD